MIFKWRSYQQWRKRQQMLKRYEQELKRLVEKTLIQFNFIMKDCNQKKVTLRDLKDSTGLHGYSSILWQRAIEEAVEKGHYSLVWSDVTCKDFDLTKQT